MTVRAVVLAVVLAGGLCAVACKDKQTAAPTPVQTPSPTVTPSAGSAGKRPEPARPSLPTPEPRPVGTPLSVEDAAKVLPPFTAKQILALKQTSDGRQVHGTWCMDGDGADDVAKQVGQQMAQAGFSALAIRGDAKKAGVQGDRDGLKLSMIVSASTAANCPAPKHYFASATIFRL